MLGTLSAIRFSLSKPTATSDSVKAMQSGEYESLIKILVGMGGNRTTDELKQAIVARGLSAEHVEELLDIAVGKRDVLDTYDGITFRYQCQRNGPVSPSVLAASPKR